jgi:predicted RNase H-like HicB family nuclease
MHKYEIVIYWSSEDKVFVAETPEFAGCAAHGKTQAEALQSLNEAIELWLETASEFGDEIPAPKEHKIAA